MVPLPGRFRPGLGRGYLLPRVPLWACSAARRAPPASAKLLVKFAPRPLPLAPATPARAKVTDKPTPPGGGAGEGHECGGGGAHGRGGAEGPGRMRGAGGRMFPKCLKLVFGFSTLDKCGAAGGARPFPRSLGPGPGPCAGVRARTPACARPAPEAAERRSGPPGAGPRAQAARLADVAARGRPEGGRRRAGALHFAALGSEGAGAGGSGKPRGVAGDLGEPC